MLDADESSWCRCRKSRPLGVKAESGDECSMQDLLTPDQVNAPRAVSVEALASGKDTHSAPSAERAASDLTAAPSLQ
jgi:hypothetical protein